MRVYFDEEDNKVGYVDVSIRDHIASWWHKSKMGRMWWNYKHRGKQSNGDWDAVNVDIKWNDQ